MFYQTKKLSELSSAFQVHLFRHYRKLLAPLNPIAQNVQIWLLLVSCVILGYALLHSTFVIFGMCLVWLFYPLSKTFLLYTPVSLSFWIFCISCFISCYGLKLCFSLPKEFRILLLIEQGLSIKIFLVNSYKYKTKIFLLVCFCLIIFYLFPKFFLIFLWSVPLLAEFYCLSGITNSFLTRNLSTIPTQTFATLLGFEYNYLMQKNSVNNFFLYQEEFFDDWLPDDEEIISTGEDISDEFLESDEMEEFDFDHDFDYEDFEESAFETDELLYQRRFTNREMLKLLNSERLKPIQAYNSSAVLKMEKLARIKKEFSEYHQLQDMSLDLKLQYKKVPSLFRYLKAKKELRNKKEILNPQLELKKKFQKKYQSIEQRLWTKAKMNSDVLKIPSNLSWYNANLPFLFDSMFDEYEEISESLLEEDVDWTEYDDIFEEPEDEIYDQELNEVDIFGSTNEEFHDVGAGDEYRAPNWFWISFFYHTLSFWVFLNIFVFCFFLFCGIPESWVLSTRVAAGKNILLYQTLLHMTEQLYTKWGFTKLPQGNFLRIDYFNYMQPSYFKRSPKVYKKLTSFITENKLHPWGWRYWGRTYKKKRLYGIAQGLSPFHKNPKYSTFLSFLYRKKSAILLDHRMSLTQNVGLLYLNPTFFNKKDQQITDFYKIVESYNVVKKN